jgi:transposase
MGKSEMIYVGIDVSAQELVVALSGQQDVRRFGNQSSGHQQLVQWLQQQAQQARVCLEASGNYSLDVALALHRQKQIQVEVVNPRLARRFAESLGNRSKTDPVDSHALAEFAARMPFTAWVAPSAAALRLRSIVRSIDGLRRMATQEKNREHAAQASGALDPIVAKELARHTRYLEQRITKLRQKALQIVHQDPELQRRYQRLLSVPGIGEVSAVQILGELAVLPPMLDARQWVAYCGLDPRHHESGSSVYSKPRISKAGNHRLRHALYMPALVAVRWDTAAAGFYSRLQERGKAKLVALTAVMRKFVHGIYGMFRNDQDYDGGMLFPSNS